MAVAIATAVAVVAACGDTDADGTAEDDTESMPATSSPATVPIDDAGDSVAIELTQAQAQLVDDSSSGIGPTLTVSEINQALEALGGQPFTEVYEVIAEIEAQARRQLEPG